MLERGDQPVESSSAPRRSSAASSRSRLQSTLGNILGGVALQLDGSIHVGDWVQLENGKQGKVNEIRWRHTVVETRDWDTIIVPNADAPRAEHHHPRQAQRTAASSTGCGSTSTSTSATRPSHVIDVVSDALAARADRERRASDPKPNVICYDFAKDGRDSFAYYAVRYWLTDLAVDDPTSSRVRARIYSRR